MISIHNTGFIMQIKDLIANSIAEQTITPPPQEPIHFGEDSFTPPFYSLGNDVTDVNHHVVCTCKNPKIARAIANLMWNHL